MIGQGLTNAQNRKAGVDFYFDPTTKKFENTVEPIIDRIDYLVPGVKQEF